LHEIHGKNWQVRDRQLIDSKKVATSISFAVLLPRELTNFVSNPAILRQLHTTGGAGPRFQEEQNLANATSEAKK
jgi:hypothetical protein